MRLGPPGVAGSIKAFSKGRWCCWWHLAVPRVLSAVPALSPRPFENVFQVVVVVDSVSPSVERFFGSE